MSSNSCHLMGLSGLSIALGGHAGQHGASFRASQDWKLGGSQWVPNLHPLFREGKRALRFLRHHSSDCDSNDFNLSQRLLVPRGPLRFKGHSQYTYVCSFCGFFFFFLFFFPSRWANMARPQALLCHLQVLSDPAAAHQVTGQCVSLCVVLCILGQRGPEAPPAEGHSHLFSPPLNTQTHGSRCLH